MDDSSKRKRNVMPSDEVPAGGSAEGQEEESH